MADPASPQFGVKAQWPLAGSPTLVTADPAEGAEDLEKALDVVAPDEEKNDEKAGPLSNTR